MSLNGIHNSYTPLLDGTWECTDQKRGTTITCTRMFERVYVASSLRNITLNKTGTEGVRFREV